MSHKYRKRSDSPFGEALKALLRQKGLTQTLFAQKSLVPAETLSRMMKGDRLKGENARFHLRSIVRACYQLGLIHTLAEANDLMRHIPAMKELDRRDSDDLAVILELEALSRQEPSDSEQQQSNVSRNRRLRDAPILEDIAWSLYVELMTRIATQPLVSKQGLLREALDSLYALFGETRAILHEAGARLATAGETPIGAMGIELLNDGLRPFMAKWHPLLQQYEKSRRADQSAYEHEQEWERAEEMRRDLMKLQERLELYAELLAHIANIPHKKLRGKDQDQDAI